MKSLKRVSLLAFGARRARRDRRPDRSRTARTARLIVRAWLTGYQEAPLSLSSPGRGFFRAIVDEDAGTIQYWLTLLRHSGHSGALALRHASPGAVVSPCGSCANITQWSRSDDAPGSYSAHAALCRASVSRSDVGPSLGHDYEPARAPAGPAPARASKRGDFAELVDAIRNDAVYVNIHTVLFPAGEIRGQLQ